MTANFDFATLADVKSYTDQQSFRLVIVPGTIRNGRMASSNLDYKNYNEVAKYYNITEDKIKKIQVK